jgi:hypothetical protein
LTFLPGIPGSRLVLAECRDGPPRGRRHRVADNLKYGAWILTSAG